MIATHELYAVGISRFGLARLVERRVLVRVRQGWFSLPGLAKEALQASRIGGAITCAHALEAHGFWALADGDLHVVVPRNAARLRSPGDSRQRLAMPAPGLRLHWRDSLAEPSRLVAGPVSALSTLRRCASDELYLASLESVLHRAPHLRPEVAAAGHRIDDGLVDGRCESGTETLFRLRMRRRVPRLRCQVHVPGVGDVDFLIGDRLVVEVDGRAFHDTASTFENDRRRDAALSALGYRVLRFSYQQVMHGWSSVERAVLAAVIRGDHR